MGKSNNSWIADNQCTALQKYVRQWFNEILMAGGGYVKLMKNDGLSSLSYFSDPLNHQKNAAVCQCQNWIKSHYSLNTDYQEVKHLIIDCIQYFTNIR